MAQIRKLQEGNTIQATNDKPVLQAGNIINKVPARKYFYIGEDLYDFKKFLDLIWRNLDTWIEQKGYGKAKPYIKKFINQAIKLIDEGTAKFNSDLTLQIKDTENAWDDRPGFNKQGPKILHPFTNDKYDDNRGGPLIAMTFMLEIIRSPYMVKKVSADFVPSLTNDVIKNLIKLEYNNNSSNFSNSDYGFYTNKLYDRIRMFKSALENFRDTTDFSVYDLKNQEKIRDNINNTINLINNTTDYNDDFFKLISNYGFYGLEKYLGKSKDLLASELAAREAESEKQRQLLLNQGLLDRLNSIESGITSNVLKQLSISEYNTYAEPAIRDALNYYYSLLSSSLPLVNDWKYNNKVGFRTIAPLGTPLIDVDENIYISQKDAFIANTPGATEATASDVGKAVARLLTRYILGRSTPHFSAGASRAKLEHGVKFVLSMANYKHNLTRLSSGFWVLPDSYDPQSRCYTVLDDKTNRLLAVPEIFVRNSFWEPIATNINNYLRSHNSPTYSTLDIMYASLRLFLRNVNLGEGTSMFNYIINYKLPTRKHGGILKALSGAEIKLQILNDTTGEYSEEVKNFYRRSSGDNYAYSTEADAVRAKTAEERKSRSARRQLANDLRSAKEDAEREHKKLDFLDDLNTVITSIGDLASNLNTHDKFVIGTLLSDLVAIGGSVSGGAFNPVTDVATLSSIINTVGMLYTDDSLSRLEKIGWGTLGIGLNVLGLIPEIGAGANALKLTKVAQKALPILSKIIRYGTMGLTGVNALGPLTKLAQGKDLTKGEWERLAYFTEALIMGRISGKGAREFKKYTKPVEAKTQYTVKTKSGNTIEVDKDVYNKIHGSKINTLKEKYGKPETALKDIHGNEINVESLKTRVVTRGIKGNGTVYGSVKNIKSGVLLKSLEELHSEFGIPKMVIDGKTTYQVPSSYLRIADRLGQRPLVVHETATEATVTEPTTVPKETVAENTPKTTVKTGGEGSETSKPTGGEASSEGTKPALPKNENNGGNSASEEKVKLLRKRVEDADTRLAKVDDDVKLFVKTLITLRYNKDPKSNWDSKGIVELMEKVQRFKQMTKGGLPSKNLRPGSIYVVSPNGRFRKIVSENIKDLAKRGSVEQYYLSRKKLLKDFENKGWTTFKFNVGGSIKKYLNPSGTINYFDELYDSREPDLTNGQKFKKFLSGLNNNRYFWQGIESVLAARFFKNRLRKQKQEPLYTKIVPNSIIPITPPDIYGLTTETNKSIGINNSLAAKAGTSKIKDYLASKYLNNLLNSNLVDTKLTKIDNLKSAFNKTLDAKLESLNKSLIETQDYNNLTQAAYRTKQLGYDIQYDQDMTALYQQPIRDKAQEAKQWAEFLRRAGLEIGKSVVDNINPINNLLLEINKQMSDLLNKYGGSRESWNEILNTKPLDSQEWADFNTYKLLYQQQAELNTLKNLWKTNYMLNVALGYINPQDDLDRILKPKPRIQDVESSSRGGTLSYSDRMSLKKLDALNKKLEYYYKVMMLEEKINADERKQRRKALLEAEKLLNKRNEMLLKASLGLK